MVAVLDSLASLPPEYAGYALHPGVRGLRASVDGVAGSVTLERLSLHDGELRLASEQEPPFGLDGELLIRLETGLEETPQAILTLRAWCRRMEREPGGLSVEFEHSLAVSDAVRLNHVLQALHLANLAHGSTEHCASVFEEVVEPRERAVALLQALLALDHEVLVHISGGRAVAPRRLLNEAHWPASSFTVDVRAPRGDYVFSVGARSATDAKRSIRLVRLESRRESLATAPPRTRLRFRHPLLGTERRYLQVATLTRSAIHVHDQPEALLYPGLHVPDATLQWKGGELQLAFVVGQSFEDPIHGSCCRLRVQMKGRVGEVRWRAEADRVCHPHTRIDADAHEALWGLYERSGYLHISDKRPQQFAPLKDKFRHASKALEQHPELGAQVTWRSIDGLDGSVTFLIAWQRSALIYQLAREGERPLWMSGARALYDLYLRATEHVLGEGAEWIVVYVQRGGARFSRRINSDFPAQFADGRRCFIGLFRAWEIPAVAGVGGPAPEGVRVGEPNTNEVSAWLRGLEDRRPLAYREAYDLVPERVWMAEPTTRFGRADLARQRAFRQAFVNGRPVAMAWMEHLEEGVHLFGLLNSIRIDFFEEVDAETEAAVRHALIGAAAEFFGALGVTQLVFFDEDLGEAPVPEAVHLGDADQALYSTALVPALIEEVAMAVAAPQS